MEWYEKTDIGRIRQTNQDVCMAKYDEKEQCALLIVCDGMGGANAGNIASMVAMQSFVQALEGAPAAATLEEGTMQMHDALRKANHTVYEMSQADMRYDGMGTTLVSAMVRHNEVVLLNVGDSRAYVLHEGTLTQLTQDHSYVSQLVRDGKLTREEARVHPQRNLITRAVGVDRSVLGDVVRVALAPQDILMLCSDGLSGMLTDAQMCTIIEEAGSLAQAGDALIHAANEAGGKDNISVVLLRHSAKNGGGA